MAKREGLDKQILLKAFEVAQAWSGQIVTLSTGVIVFTAIFRKDIVGEAKPFRESHWLWYSWVALGIAAILGIFFTATLIAMLNRGKEEELDVYKIMSRIIASLELVSFVLGIVFFVVFLWFNFP